MITYVKGNLIEMAKEGRFDLILHGCNCQHAMTSGIAKTIADVFPSAQVADFKTWSGDIKKLGDFSVATEPDDNGLNFLIINLYTQYEPGAHAEYAAIRASLKAMKAAFVVGPFAEDGLSNQAIGLPWIGAGIGGLDIEYVKQIIEEELGSYDVTMVEFG